MKFSCICAFIATATAVQLDFTDLSQTGSLEETQSRLEELETNLAQLQNQEENPHLLATKYMKKAKDIMLGVAKSGRKAEKKANEEHVTELTKKIEILNKEKKHIQDAELLAEAM